MTAAIKKNANTSPMTAHTMDSWHTGIENVERKENHGSYQAEAHDSMKNCRGGNCA